MSCHEMLFVGGPEDGKRVAIPESKDLVVVNVEMKSRTRRMFTQVLYRRERIMSNDALFSVFLENSLNGDDLIDLLIKGYKTI